MTVEAAEKEEQSLESEREFLGDIKSGKYKKERIAKQKRRLEFGEIIGEDWKIHCSDTFKETIVDNWGGQIRRAIIERLVFKWLLENQNKTLEYRYETYTVLEYFARVEEMTIENIMDLAIQMDAKK